MFILFCGEVGKLRFPFLFLLVGYCGGVCLYGFVYRVLSIGFCLYGFVYMVLSIGGLSRGRVFADSLPVDVLANPYVQDTVVLMTSSPPATLYIDSLNILC